MQSARFPRVVSARCKRATWRNEIALRTHSPAQQVRSKEDKRAHDGRPLPVGRGLFDRIWMRLIRTAQTSPRRPATQRGSTHQTGCSHMVCVRPAPRNPKQGPSFCLVVPDVPQHPCMYSMGFAQFGRSPSEVHSWIQPIRLTAALELACALPCRTSLTGTTPISAPPC